MRRSGRCRASHLYLKGGRVFVSFGPICVLQPYFVDIVLAKDLECCVRGTFFVFGAQGTRANVAKP